MKAMGSPSPFTPSDSEYAKRMGQLCVHRRFLNVRNIAGRSKEGAYKPELPVMKHKLFNRNQPTWTGLYCRALPSTRCASTAECFWPSRARGFKPENTLSFASDDYRRVRRNGIQLYYTAG